PELGLGKLLCHIIVIPIHDNGRAIGTIDLRRFQIATVRPQRYHVIWANEHGLLLRRIVELYELRHF
ncbi:MAG TPA: hypothetical protein VGG30_07840, partial [Pirellulales bacterium]